MLKRSSQYPKLWIAMVFGTTATGSRLGLLQRVMDLEFVEG
jgi:hypothetical protein